MHCVELGGMLSSSNHTMVQGHSESGTIYYYADLVYESHNDHLEWLNHVCFHILITWNAVALSAIYTDREMMLNHFASESRPCKKHVYYMAHKDEVLRRL